MTSELLTEATLAERQRVYEGLRWMREWRRVGRPTGPDALPARFTPTVKSEEQANRCPSTEARMAAGR